APFIAEQAVGLVSVQAEVELGDKMTETLFANLEVNEEKSETLTAFFEASGFESEYPIRLYYVEEPVVNAFAVPGGKIVVFEGIVDLMDSWEELAGLLGHELAHVEERHSLEAMSRSLSTYLVFSIMTGDVNGVGAVLLENTMMLQDLSNSRKAEVEADQKGFEYLLGQEVSPRGMIDLFVHLQEAEPDLGEQGNQLMEIMSTHPLTTDRIANLEKAYEDAGQPSFEEKTEAQALFEQLRAKEMSDLEISEEEEEETATLDE
ncbi:MAG: M48 family metallopeptidase, partial [Bacteroidota bacterium]